MFRAAVDGRIKIETQDVDIKDIENGMERLVVRI